MNLLTPSKACVYIKRFNSRIDRLALNIYTDKRFRIYDINRLKIELKSIQLVCSVAIWNKNESNAAKLIKEAENRINIGREILFNSK